MGFEVLSTELTSAAGKVEQAVSSRVCSSIPLTNLSAASCGHVELAEWLTPVKEDADRTIRSLAQRGNQIAEALRQSATAYECTESGVQSRFPGRGQVTAR